jgi:lysozyme family protein
MTFENAVAFTLNEEGGISANPDDRGGLTKFGISSRQYPQVRLSNFSKDDAIAIYKRDYWDRLQCDNLPWASALVLFDSAVNHGQAQACRWLQQALQIKADGIMGTITIRASWEAKPEALLEVLASRALDYARDSEFIHFGRGWMKRLFRLQTEFTKGNT